MSTERLLIVYNAEAGVAAGIRDSIHKLLRPDTYPCGLCALTHGLVRQDPAWTRFLTRIPRETRVYHRPDFRDRYPDLDICLPAILIETSDDTRVLIGADELRAIETIDDLTARIDERLGQ